MDDPIVFKIVQGEKYQKIFLISGDYSLRIPKAQIRANYGDHTWVINWDFLPLTYNPTTNQTSVTTYLGATKTSILPLPFDKNINIYKPGQNVWVTDFELHNSSDPDDVIKIFGRSPVYVLIFPEATLNNG